MTERFEALLAPVARTRGVRAVILAAEDDGVPVHAVAHDGIDTDTLAALGCRIYRGARLASEHAGFGPSSIMHMEAEHGQVCVAQVSGNGDHSLLVVIALAERDANVGALRLVLSRAALDAQGVA